MLFLNPRTMEKSEGLRPSDLSPAATKPQENIVQPQGYNMSQDSDFSAPENVILQTTNYGMFKFDPLNRVIRQDKLDRLYEAVKTKNMLHLFPIVVTRDLVIVDGQHRFKVAEALNTPIYFIVSNQMRIEDAALVNTNTHTWRGSDYLDHWCKVGLPDYIWFRDFWAANQFLSFSTAMKLLSFGGTNYSERTDGNRSLTVVFNEGKFKISDLAFAGRVTGMARDFSVWVRFWSEASFIGALMNLAANPDYDHAHMMKKLEYLSIRLVKCPDSKTYLQVLEGIYNYRVSDSKKVHFKFMYPRDRNPRQRAQSTSSKA